QARAWRELGLALPIAVNLSARNLHDPELPAAIAALLEEEGVGPELLELEITESAVMHEPARVGETLARLRAMGLELAIDDFGTGYSSLAYLKRLPVQALKIDRGFVKDMATDPGDAAIVRATIALAHALGLRVVAEGVKDRL